MISNVLPKYVFAGNTLIVSTAPQESILVIVASTLLNSFIVDWILRQKVTTHCNMFYVYQTPVPRFTPGDPYFGGLVERAARLICTTPEYDALAAAAGLGDHRAGVTDTAERARLRAEIDGIAAHLYRLTEAEYVHILGTFPLVAAPVKAAALAAFGAVERGEIK